VSWVCFFLSLTNGNFFFLLEVLFFLRIPWDLFPMLGFQLQGRPFTLFFSKVDWNSKLLPPFFFLLPPLTKFHLFSLLEALSLPPIRCLLPPPPFFPATSPTRLVFLFFLLGISVFFELDSEFAEFGEPVLVFGAFLTKVPPSDMLRPNLH